MSDYDDLFLKRCLPSLAQSAGMTGAATELRETILGGKVELVALTSVVGQVETITTETRRGNGQVVSRRFHYRLSVPEPNGGLERLDLSDRKMGALLLEPGHLITAVWVVRGPEKAIVLIHNRTARKWARVPGPIRKSGGEFVKAEEIAASRTSTIIAAVVVFGSFAVGFGSVILYQMTDPIILGLIASVVVWVWRWFANLPRWRQMNRRARVLAGIEQG
ncbi:MAG: hypothetical protein AAGH68_14260 [Pseudomonadota bacterium]